MKKILFTILLVFSFVIGNAQSLQRYRATSYAIAEINQYNGNYRQSDWYQCDVRIVFDLAEDVITIFSKSPQQYYVTRTENSYTDNSGGQQVVFTVVDQDNDRGHLRLRVERNGNSQLYVDFPNMGVAWVYNLYRTN